MSEKDGSSHIGGLGYIAGYTDEEISENAQQVLNEDPEKMKTFLDAAEDGQTDRFSEEEQDVD